MNASLGRESTCIQKRKEFRGKSVGAAPFWHPSTQVSRVCSTWVLGTPQSIPFSSSSSSVVVHGQQRGHVHHGLQSPLLPKLL